MLHVPKLFKTHLWHDKNKSSHSLVPSLLILEDPVTLEQHVKKVVQLCFYHLRNTSKIRSVLPFSNRKLYMIFSCLLYFPEQWSSSKTKRFSHIIIILASLQCLLVSLRIHLNLNPTDCVTQRWSSISESRFKNQRTIERLQVLALQLWNSRPLSIRSADSITAFKSFLKMYFYRMADWMLIVSFRAFIFCVCM